MSKDKQRREAKKPKKSAIKAPVSTLTTRPITPPITTPKPAEK
jgi:hypothetical protein